MIRECSHWRTVLHKFYYPLPTNLSALNDQVCGPSNSKGLLCGECQDGFAVAALWNIFCINCTGASNGWIKFVATEYLPLTVIFILIIICAINIVSGPINSFIFFAQVNSLIYITFSFTHAKAQDIPTYIDSLRRSPGTVVCMYPLQCLELKCFPLGLHSFILPDRPPH